MLGTMAEAGRRCELYAVHGHYADAGEVAVLMSSTLGVPMIMTGHSLGRNKLEHLLASGGSAGGDGWVGGLRVGFKASCREVGQGVGTREVGVVWGMGGELEAGELTCRQCCSVLPPTAAA